MSFSNVSTDINELHKIWLCNGCFGSFFLNGFYGGSTTEITTIAARDTTISLKIGSTVVADRFIYRKYNKQTEWFDLWFDPHAYVDNPEQTWATYWGNIADGCWGNTEKEFHGSYSVNSEWSSGRIYYADLRDDILVYYSENGGHAASQSGDTPMGFHQAYASWNGGEPTCQGVNITDAILLRTSTNSHYHGEERITLGNYTPFSESKTESGALKIAISDEFSQIDTMAIIDESKPYNCRDGVFSELIVHERLDGYSNSWDTAGSITAMDPYDYSLWEQSFLGQGINHLKDGVYDYPNFIEIDAMPKGSFATDASGNYFHSMITKDMKTFNKLNSNDPNTLTGFTGGGIVYYPIAPV